MRLNHIIKFGVQQSKIIGKHYHLIGNCKQHDDYLMARSESDQAESLIKYLITHLQDRHQAVILANAAGCPGYINYR